jgi:hypothetical protein
VPKHREGHAHLVASLHTPLVPTGAHLPQEQLPRGRGMIVAASTGLLVLIVIVGLVALSRDPGSAGRPQGGSAADQHAGHGGAAEGRPGSESGLSSPTGPDGVQGLQSALRHCAAAWGEDRMALHAGQPAIRQWQVHVGVMDRLVAGQLTLDQANAFWERTRVGAAQRVRRFDHADRRLESAGAAKCPGGAVTTAAGSASGSRLRTLRSCREAVAATDETLTALRAAMATWQRHIRDMNRLRSGMLDPVHAQHMWLHDWRRGQAEISRYQLSQERSAPLVCRP